VLTGGDGIVFVADSSSHRLSQPESLEDLNTNLADHAARSRDAHAFQ